MDDLAYPGVLMFLPAGVAKIGDDLSYPGVLMFLPTGVAEIGDDETRFIHVHATEKILERVVWADRVVRFGSRRTRGAPRGSLVSEGLSILRYIR